MTWNERFNPRDLDVPEDLDRSRRMLAALKTQSRSKRVTAVEVLCTCEQAHLLFSVHPTSSQEQLALWQHGGPWTHTSDVAQVDDPLSFLADAVTALRAADPTDEEPPRRIRRGDTLSIRSLPLLRDGMTYLGSVVAPCLARSALNPTAGSEIAAAYDRWVAGGRRAPERLYIG